MLKHLSRVHVEFNPLDRRAAAALEFLSQCKGRKAKEANAECEVTYRRRTDDEPPYVEVTYVNGVQEKLECEGSSVQRMRDVIMQKGFWMETERMFRENKLPWPIIIPQEEIDAARAADKEKEEKRKKRRPLFKP